MFNIRDIQTQIINGVHKLTGLQGMYGDPNTNVTRPTSTYFAVTYKSSYKEGLGIRKYHQEVEGLTEDLTQIYVLNFSVSFYKQNSQGMALLASSGMQRSDIRSLLTGVNCAYRSASSPFSFSEPLMDGWEERATFDLEVATQMDLTTELDYIESFKLTGEIVYPEITIQVDTTIGSAT